MFSFLIPVFLLVNYYIYFNNISTCKTSSIQVYASSTILGAYGYNPVLMLPLLDLAGNAVLVWYSML